MQPPAIGRLYGGVQKTQDGTDFVEQFVLQSFLQGQTPSCTVSWELSVDRLWAPESLSPAYGKHTGIEDRSDRVKGVAY